MTTPTPWQRRMRAFQNDLHQNDPHANTMEAFLVYPADVGICMMSSRPENIAIAQAIGQWVGIVGRGEKPLCATCEHEFKAVIPPGFSAFIVARSAFTRDAGHMLVSGPSSGSRVYLRNISAPCAHLSD